MIHSETGSALSPRPDSKGVVVIHLCNNEGRWGAGFVLAVDELSSVPRAAYKAIVSDCRLRGQSTIPMGFTQFIEIPHIDRMWVVNMIAQRLSGDGCLVDYDQLRACLVKSLRFAALMDCDVHLPAGMGSGLAKGDRKMIFDLIDQAKQEVNRELGLVSYSGTPKTKITAWEFQDTTAKSFVPSRQPDPQPNSIDDLDATGDVSADPPVIHHT